MTPRKYLWPLGLGVVSAVLAKNDISGNVTIIGMVAFLGAAFIVGASIGFAVLGLATGATKRVRLASWAVASGLFGGVCGIYGHELVRPAVFGTCAAFVGLVVGLSLDGFVTRRQYISKRTGLIAVAIVLAVVLLAVVYVVRNWIETSR